MTRVATADGVVWFKECAPGQGFEPSPSAGLSARWPDRVADVVAHDEDHGWLLMRDAGQPVREVGNPPELWLAALPLYAELQRAECAFAADHVDRLGAPDLLLVRSADRSSDLVERELAVEEDAQTRLAGHLPDVERLCADLATSGVPESIQHDGLHMSNLYLAGSRLRVLDWGQFSLTPVRLARGDVPLPPGTQSTVRRRPWFARLRDAYLEPWGTGLRDTFDLGLRVGAVATPLLLCLSGTRSPKMPVTASTRTSHGDCVMRSRRYSGSQKRRTGPGTCAIRSMAVGGA